MRQVGQQPPGAVVLLTQFSRVLRVVLLCCIGHIVLLNDVLNNEKITHRVKPCQTK